MTNGPMTNNQWASAPRTQARSGFLGFRHGSLAILILLSFALRLYNLGKPEFWFDEAISANIADLGWRGAIDYLRSEPFEHPPAYYLSLNPWLRLAGASEFALRFYSVICGVLIVPLLYVLVKRMAGQRLAWLTVLLAALSPFLVAYSQEARMYTLMPLLALLVLLSFLRALEVQGRSAWWLVYAALIFAGVATHYYFALIWVATTTYLLLEWPRRGQGWRWGLAVQSVFFLAGVVWLVAASGPRSSVVRVLQGETAFSLAYKLNKVMPTLMLAEIRPAGVSGWGLVLAMSGWILVLIGAWAARRSLMLKPQVWRLLMLWIVVPLVASLLIPYGVLGRHLGYTLIAGLPFMACGLLALRRLGRFWLAAGIAVVLLMASYGLVAQYTIGKGDYGQAMAYVDEHAQAGDLLILTQPAQQHLIDYYNRERWPVRYLPTKDVTLTPSLVREELTRLTRSHTRFWLGPIGPWTADPDSLVEHWLVTHTFQAEKTWFPESTSVALYFTADDALQPLETGPLIWSGRLLLQKVEASGLQVPVGDALRLRLHWRAGLDLGERYEVSLRLVDDQGRIWAERRSEPCGGWCLTDSWRAGHLQLDQHALLVPPGTPPGQYRLQAALVPLGGGAALAVEQGGERLGQATLAEVTVVPGPGSSGMPSPAPNPLEASFGGEVTLLGYEPAVARLQPGQMFHLETYWRASAAPAADYSLAVALVDGQGRSVVSWSECPSSCSYPTSQWPAGAYVRGQHDLDVPGSLSPGTYEVRVSLVGPSGELLPLDGQAPRQVLGGLLVWNRRLGGTDLPLGSLQVVDRPRDYDLPPVEHPLEVTIGQKAHLLGYDLDTSRANPGGQVGLTLYWQADGPLAKPFKVFTHLVDAQGVLRAQHDGPPGAGCCPTNTWVAGEVIVDHHPIRLGADLPPGDYQIVAGLYEEEADTRLPALDADGQRFPHDLVPVGQVVVTPAKVTEQPGVVVEEPVFQFEHRIFLPLIGQGEQ
jgi:uncharacterized membrane protein